MKKLTIYTVVLLALLSGCDSSVESAVEPVKEEITTLTPSEVNVIMNEAKSSRILPENQVKDNVAYTHFSVSGARYQ